MNKPTLYISHKAWIPVDSLAESSIRQITKRYSIRRYDENVCRPCSNRPYRHNEICETCPNNGFIDTLRLYKHRDIQGQEYIGLPVGDKKNFRNIGIALSDYTIVDKRIERPFADCIYNSVYRQTKKRIDRNHDKYKVKFTESLYSYQIPVVEAYAIAKYGMMQCPPRTGKSAMAVYLAVNFQQRTMILANQNEFLQQIENHIRRFTNIEEIEKIVGYKLCGFPKKLEDYDNFLFCLTTYQKFISEKGKLLLNKVKNKFGTVIVDEAHGVAALKFAETIATFYPKYLMGMTATPERKDGRHIITEYIIGPVTAQSKRESLPVVMSVFETPVKYARSYKNFVYAMRFLSRHEERNEYIVQHVLHDLKTNPNASIVIPLMFKDHVLQMTKAINDDMGEKVAESFMGGGGESNKKQRLEILDRARSGKTRVVVGIRKLLQLGVDCPAWNLLYEVMPIANKPMLYQETSRIRTPNPLFENKQPRIKFFVDVELGQSLGCFRATLGHLRSDEFRDYHWTEKSKERLRVITAGSGRFYGKDIDLTTEDSNEINNRLNRTPTKYMPTLFDVKAYTGANDASNRRKRL